ncbi:hypothetical protein [Yoonia sp. 2307UL14-13]|uniref:hypothetical protein n=1 Tax=Yoonia sp. 2307UL14-13 TaxID=3126506 RepID=UPI0030A33A90
MPAQLTEFTEIPDLPGIYTATKGGLRCNAIRLSDDTLCLHSPVAGFGDIAKSSLETLGKVSALLAPNQYHNKGLPEYAATFPSAALIAPMACHERLTKITGLTFQSPAILDLPDTVQIITPEGLKTGEIWLCTKTAWLVTDAFAGPAKPGGDATLLKTFPRYGIGDAQTYRQWITKFIAKNPPTTLIPCHGAIVSDPKLGDQLRALTSDLG